MKRRIRRLSALILVMAMCLSILSANVWATETESRTNRAESAQRTGSGLSVQSSNGTCGALDWTLDDSGVLSITGTGAMPDYDQQDSNVAPWYGLEVKEVIIDEGVTSIGQCAFQDCTSLESITIPSTVSEIGAGAFYQCTSLFAIQFPTGLTAINDSTFAHCESLDGIEIPETVSTIGQGAFSYCESLYSIEIPEAVSTISEGAFEHCTSLLSLTLNEGVVIIEEQAFEYCESLESVDVPPSVTTIGERAFGHCSALSDLTIQTSEETQEGTVTSGSLSIGVCAFEHCTSLKMVVIPDTVNNIGNYAFRYCTRLETVFLPDDLLDSISQTTDTGTIFEGTPYQGVSGECGKNLEWNLKYNDVERGVLTITCNGDGTEEGDWIMDDFNNEGDLWSDYADSIREVIIQNGVQNIGESAFSGYQALRAVTIPNSVQSIGSYAFYNCQKLKTVTIPNPLPELGDDAFEGTPWWSIYNGEEVLFPDLDNAVTLELNTPIDVELTKSAHVRTYVFSPEENEEFVIYSSNPVGSDPFCILFNSEDDELISDDDSGGENNFRLRYNLSANETYYFVVSSNDEENTSSFSMAIALYDPIKCGENAIWSYDDETGTVTVSGSGKIYDYTGAEAPPWSDISDDITGVVIESGITSIGMGAFSQTANLTQVDLPEGLVAISEGAFDDCPSLKSLTIPASVTTIGDYAYGFCYKSEEYSLIENATIKGYAGSAAQTYAEDNGITFVELEANILLGDVDGDGKILINDTMLLFQAVQGITTLDDNAQLRSDVDGDGKILINDVMLVFQYVQNIITEFPQSS